VTSPRKLAANRTRKARRRMGNGARLPKFAAGATGFAFTVRVRWGETMSSLANRVVIVTGASAGIGEATVRRLVRAGAKVVLNGRRAERLTGLCAQIDSSGGSTLAVPGDVTDDADRRALVEAACAKFGRIDALVNNAGFGTRGPIECVPVEAIRRNFETNLFSLIALVQLVAPIMRAQGAGRIVNVSSVAGKIARPMSAVYDATKHALEAVSDGLRGELAPFGVKVVVVRPGFIRSEFIEKANEASGDLLAKAEPYARQIGAVNGAVSRLKKLAGAPDDVARVIEKALACASPKTHYAAPAHAKVFLAAKWLLPTRVFDRIVRLEEGVDEKRGRG
jgi:NAD(P)-dependent dehydrogenase (short-subunit alcohol dehydrogenase family)